MAWPTPRLAKMRSMETPGGKCESRLSMISALNLMKEGSAMMLHSAEMYIWA